MSLGSKFFSVNFVDALAYQTINHLTENELKKNVFLGMQKPYPPAVAQLPRQKGPDLTGFVRAMHDKVIIQEAQKICERMPSQS